MPPWYCTSCNQSYPTQPTTGMCPHCPDQAVLDLGSPRERDYARELEQEEALERFRRIEWRSCLFVGVPLFLGALGLLILPAALWIASGPKLNLGPAFGHIIAAGIAGTVASAVVATRRFARKRFLRSEAARARAPGGALEAELKGELLGDASDIEATAPKRSVWDGEETQRP